MTTERPQTARPNLGSDTSRKGSSSPYHALPGSASVLGLQMRPKTAHTSSSSAATEGTRSLYVRVPRPPGNLREYAPLRPRAQSSGEHGRAWQEDSECEDGAQSQFDSVHDSGVRPLSARITVRPTNNSQKKPPMSARGRLQSDSVSNVKADGDNHNSMYEKEGEYHADVAIFPAANKTGFMPPQPQFHDPSPRRRPMSAQVTRTSSSELHAMPTIVEPPGGLPHGTRREGNSVGRTAQSRGAMLKDLAPVMSAIASLTHETNLGKLVRQIDAVVLVLLEADASRLALYNQHHRLLQVVRPGESDHQISHSHHNQFEVEGIMGLCAEACTSINVPDVHEQKDVRLDCDLGFSNLPDTQHVSYLAAPAPDKSGKVVAVISAIRLGLKGNPFDEESIQIMELIAQQAGIAVSLCLQRLDMQRAKVNSKILVKAAVELTSSADLDIGSLTVLASVYAKKLVDCDSVLVCLTHDQHRFLRTWSMTDGDTVCDKQDKTLLNGEVQLIEREHIPVPPMLKKVVTTGSLANLLLRGTSRCKEQGQLAYLNESGLEAFSVIEGETLEYQSNSDSCLAVPLQTETGANIMGIIIATNKFGGPRTAGKGGIFNTLDEEALKELANIVSAALCKLTRMADLESVIALAPTLTQHTRATSALSEVCRVAVKPLKADHIFIFTLEEDGNYMLHDTSDTQTSALHLKHPRNSRQQAKTKVQLSANSYPLTAAVQSRKAQRVRIPDVSDVIINKRNGLIPFAADMLACQIRDSDGILHGVIVAASKTDTFQEYCPRLLGDICAQVGAVLRMCGQYRQKDEHVKALKNASKEMLSVVNKREIKTILDHVDHHVCSFMCCSRAVLYIIDRRQNLVWTLLKEAGDPKGGGEEESIITFEIKSGVDPNTEGSRVGYANSALYEGKAVVVKDFAYGQHAYNDLLDSADIKHVQKLLKIQSGAYDAATSALLRSELEPEQRTESIAAVPVHDSEGEVIAVLQVMNRFKSASVRKMRKEGFDSDDLDKLQLMASALSSTLETSARLNRQWEREDELRSIIDTSNDGLKLAMAVTCRVNLNDGLSYVAKSANTRCGASQVTVYLLDDEGQMDVIRFEGSLFVPCKSFKAPVEGIAGETIKTGQKLNIANAHQHPHFNASVDEKMLLPVASLLTCPIRDPNGRIVGALAFQNKKSSHKNLLSNDSDPFRAFGTHSARKAVMMQGHDSGWQAFDKCDERLVEAAAQGLGVALMQFRLFENISNVSERLKDISLELELERTSDAIADACRQLCKSSHCMVFLLDEKNGDMMCRMHAESINFRLPRHYGIPGAVRKRGGTIFYNDASNLKQLVRDQQNRLLPQWEQVQGQYRNDLERYRREYDGLWNCMGVSMVDGNGRIIGALEIGNKVGRNPFTPQDERLIKVIASHAYTCIKHCLRYEATVAKVECNRDITHQLVGLVKEISATYPQTLEYATAYRDIVEATCKIMGAARGHLYITIAASHRQWMAYDRNGKQMKGRQSQVAARVLEGGILINNTKISSTTANDGGNASTSAGAQSLSSSPVHDDLQDSKIMCAPLTSIDQQQGIVVIGVLEVEAHLGQVFKEHEVCLRICMSLLNVK